MLQLTGAGKRFGPKLLFDNLNWLITPKERAGIVGGNGTGKTTLLKVIAGMESLDYGSVDGDEGLGDRVSSAGRPSRHRAHGICGMPDVFAELKEIEQELETLTGKMSELDPDSREYHARGGPFCAARSRVPHARRLRDGGPGGHGSGRTRISARKIGPGCTDEFSGGWQMRIALAKLLLAKPNLLLLDEPTNHLDLEARNWLEDYLTHYERVCPDLARSLFPGRHGNQNRRDLE